VPYRDLREFISQLEARRELKRVRVPVDPKLEMTEMCDRVLKAGGPALLFENPLGNLRSPGGNAIPVLGNLFGTPQRVARAMGVPSVNVMANHAAVPERVMASLRVDERRRFEALRSGESYAPSEQPGPAQDTERPNDWSGDSTPRTAR